MKKLISLILIVLVMLGPIAQAQLPVSPGAQQPVHNSTMAVAPNFTPMYVPSWIGAEAIVATKTLGQDAATLQTVSALVANVDVTLPAAVNTLVGTAGKTLAFKAIDLTHTIVIRAGPGDTIDGASTASMTTLNQCLILMSDGTNTWRVITTGSGGGGGSGTVTDFSAGNLSPLFSTSVGTSTTTPVLSFALSNAGAHTYFGNNTGSSTAPSFLTATQVTADLNLFSSSLQGLVPASGGGTSNFLRADGTWAAPASGGTPGGTNGQVQYNNSGVFGGFTASGDATINTGTGAVAVTKTGGVSFAPSATTDTTNAANISSGVLPIARGGTNNGSLSVTQGSVPYMDGTKITALAPGAIGQYERSGGAAANPTWATNLYNTQGEAQDPTLQPNLQAGIQAVRDGTDDCVVCAVGDSTMFGYGATGNQSAPMGNQYTVGTPANRLRQQLATKYNVPVAEGFSGPNYGGFTGGGLCDNRWTNSTAWPTSGFGFFSSGAMQGNPALGTANDTLSFTPGYEFDTIVVYYNRLPAGGGFGGGTTTVNVNGGSSLATINTNGAGPTFVAQTVSVGSLVTGTINFTRPTVDLTVIVGVWAYNSTRKAVYVHNLGIIGAFTTSFSNAGSWALFPTRKWSLIQLGINDAQGASPVGTWLPIMQGVIAAAAVAGDVTACTVYPSQNGTVAALERQYATALLADSKTSGTYTIDDINGQWGGVYQTALMFDGLHPNNLGYLYGASSFSATTGFASGALPTASNGTVPVTTFLSSAQINGMNATPVTLVAAPGAGKAILVDRIVFHMVTTGTAFAGGGAVSFPYAGGGAATTNTIASAVVTAGAGTTDTIVYGKDVTASLNAALQITNATAAFTTGTGWASVTVYYSIVGASVNWVPPQTRIAINSIVRFGRRLTRKHAS